MALPVNINELINGKTVEWERIEFRKGWNPERTIKIITAFANDFNNWGGGYIILGIEEEAGKPVLPPLGIELYKIDKIQKELNNICRKIIPNYFPIVEPVDFQGKKILILWCPGGSVRPYKCPESLKEKSQYVYYIKRFSNTVKPTVEDERELFAMANKVPFDDRVNHRYKITDFDLSAIKTFLNKVGSELENEIPNLNIEEIARRMNIAEGANENLLPKNVGLLFFAKETQKIFSSAKIEVVIFEDNAGTVYTEKIFEGNLSEQIFNVLDFLKNQIVKEKIIKRPDKAEADRYFNYPYQALEEAVCNAVFHRGYDNDSPIEIRIYPDHLDIISFPGPLPPLNKEKLKNYQFDVRKYRNRRIGEFLKELHLTEGRSTGIPTILRELEKNGSPKPIFETDDERSYFKTSFFIHQEFKKKETNLGQMTQQAPSKHPASTQQDDREKEILAFCKEAKTREEIQKILDIKDREYFRSEILKPLIDKKLLQMTIPDKPSSPKQKYVITEKGKELIKIEEDF